jgi:hypothetical protein
MESECGDSDANPTDRLDIGRSQPLNSLNYSRSRASLAESVRFDPRVVAAARLRQIYFGGVVEDNSTL